MPFKVERSKESGTSWLLLWGVAYVAGGIAAATGGPSLLSTLKTLGLSQQDIFTGIAYLALASLALKGENPIWLYVGALAMVADGAVISFVKNLTTTERFGLEHLMPVLKLLVAAMVLKGAITMGNPFQSRRKGLEPTIRAVDDDDRPMGTWGAEAPAYQDLQPRDPFGIGHQPAPDHYEKPTDQECPVCGHVVGATKKFCPKCGNKMG